MTTEPDGADDSLDDGAQGSEVRPAPPAGQGRGAAAEGRGEDLLAATAGLAEEDGTRARTARVRRRQRVVRGAAASPGLDDATEPEQVRVRSEAQEVPRPAPQGSTGSPATPGSAAAPSAPATSQAPASVGSPAGLPGVVDPAVFLADATRSYLAGVDAHGLDHPVTRDRLDRLRQTLARWDGEQPPSA